MYIQSTCANACTVCASDMTNSHSSLPSEQAKDTRELCFTFFTSVCSLAFMWLNVLCLCMHYAKIKMLKHLNQISKKCLILQDVCGCMGLHLHLADAFIQSDLQLHSGYTFSLVCVFPGNRTHNHFAADAMLYH